MSQPYQELAEADKQRSIQEYLAYLETDMYKQFIRNKHPALKKQKTKEKEPPSKPTEKVRGSREGGKEGVLFYFML